MYIILILLLLLLFLFMMYQSNIFNKKNNNKNVRFNDTPIILDIPNTEDIIKKDVWWSDQELFTFKNATLTEYNFIRSFFPTIKINKCFNLFYYDDVEQLMVAHSPDETNVFLESVPEDNVFKHDFNKTIKYGLRLF